MKEVTVLVLGLAVLAAARISDDKINGNKRASKWLTHNRYADSEKHYLESVLKKRRTVNCPSAYSDLSSEHSYCATPSKLLVADRSGVSSSERTKIVNAHNNYRSGVNPKAAAMPKLVWDSDLAAVAQAFINTCQFKHDSAKQRAMPGYGVHIGQNLGAGHADWEAAVNYWYNEVQYFTFGKGSNTAGETVGHYTQVVSGDTVRIGCGFATCSPSTYTKYYVCNYAQGRTNTATPYESAGRSCSKCSSHCSKNLCDCGGLLCKNGGQLDMNTCTCTCKAPYTGDDCSKPNCPDFDAEQCWRDHDEKTCEVYDNIPGLCPNMCGTCPNRCPGMTVSTCKNGGTPNVSNCKCVCGPDHTGPKCETAYCPSQPDQSYCGSQWKPEFCTEYPDQVPKACPHMCGCVPRYRSGAQ